MRRSFCSSSGAFWSKGLDKNMKIGTLSRLLYSQYNVLNSRRYNYADTYSIGSDPSPRIKSG
jgi:hypothetical protein